MGCSYDSPFEGGQRVDVKIKIRQIQLVTYKSY